ncbi:MAG: arylsulfatase A-like enzyme [Planctomycetota bacterium]|jgi:arylsulfatase A-like enzyme
MEQVALALIEVSLIRMRRAAARLLGIPVVILASCGGQGATSGGATEAAAFRRIISQETESPSASLDAQILTTLRASDAPSPWTGTAHGGVQPIQITSPAGAEVVATELLGRDQLKYVRGPVPEGARAFNQVTIEVVVDASGTSDVQEQARLYLYRGGEKLMGAMLADLERHGDMQVVTFRSPHLRGDYVVPDEFAVAFIGSVEGAALASVTFSEAPIESFAPPLAADSWDELPLVRVGTTSRRSFGILGGHPFKTSFTLGEGEEFRSYLALVPEAARTDEQARFTVRATGNGREWTRTFEGAGFEGPSLEDAGAEGVNSNRWHAVVLPHEALGAGDIQLEVSLESSVGDGAGIGALAEPTVRRSSGSKTSPPTVLLITSDTHRADHIGVASPNAPVSTPHIDALARRGVHFLDCVAPTNVTAPSHVSLMTGLHVRDTGILTNRDTLSQDAETIATRFRDAGYETLAATSVFHLSQAQSGIGLGFDRIDAPLKGERPGVEAIELMTQWIRDAGGAPVFAWVHLYDAHTPYSPPEAYARRYLSKDGDPFAGEPLDVGEAELPGWLRGLSDEEYPHSLYRGEIDFVDGSLGQLLDLPRVQGGVTAFTADHGELFGEHGIWWSHAGLYPGIVQIPLVMAWPGAPAGARVPGDVRLTDVARTLVGVSGLDASDMPGRDLRAFLEEAPPQEPRFFLGAHHYAAAIQSDGWFLTMALVGHKSAAMGRGRQTGEVELYHLVDDPTCGRDVLLERFDQARALRTRLIQWLDDAPEERLNGSSAASDGGAADAMLAALGYSGGASVHGVRYWDPEGVEAGWADSPWRQIFESEGPLPPDAARVLGR